MKSQNLGEQLTVEKWQKGIPKRQKRIPKGSMAAAVFGSGIFAESSYVLDIIWGYLKDLWLTDETIFIYEAR